MKKYALLLFLITTNAFSQQKQKKQYYYDVDWTKITRNKFIERDNERLIIDRIIENDTAIIGKLFNTIDRGILPKKDMVTIYNYLETISSRQIDTTHIIVINYFSGMETDKPLRKTYGNSNMPGYLKKLKKIENLTQLWVYNNDNNLKYYYSTKFNWLQDKDRLLEKAFFSVPFPFGGFAVFHPNGNYLVYHGEHHMDDIFEGIKTLNEENGN